MAGGGGKGAEKRREVRAICEMCVPLARTRRARRRGGWRAASVAGHGARGGAGGRGKAGRGPRTGSESEKEWREQSLLDNLSEEDSS